MSDMFGAPIGISHGMQDQNRNVLSGLTAAETLGKIAQQPAELELKQAHARLYKAEAGVKEGEMAAEAALAQLARGGQPSEAATPEALAQNFVNMGAKLTGAGFVKRGQDLVAKGVTIQQHLAQTEAAQGSAQLRQVRAAEARAQQVAALTTAAKNEASYQQIRMHLLQEPIPGVDPTTFPETYAEAAAPGGFIASAQARAIKMLDQVKLAEKKIVDKARIAALGASAGRNAAAADILRAKLPMVKQDAAEMEKNGGRWSDAAVESRRVMTETHAAKRAAEDRKEFPPIPPEDLWKDMIGKKFTWPGNRKVRIEKNPTTGKPEAVLLEMPPLLKPVGRGSSAVDTSGDASALDDMEEE